MSFTIMETTETHRPYVAVYKMGPDEYLAAPVLGWATYRNYSDKDAENLLVPITFSELNSLQAHYERTRKDVMYRLPQHVFVDEALFTQLMDWAIASTDLLYVEFDRSAKRWVVA